MAFILILSPNNAPPVFLFEPTAAAEIAAAQKTKPETTKVESGRDLMEIGTESTYEELLNYLVTRCFKILYQ